MAGFCKRCGDPLSDNERCCSKCGTQAPTSAAANPGKPGHSDPVSCPITINCTRCGAVLQPGAKFCKKCGISVSTSPRQASGATQVCTRCGAVLQSDAMFCKKCGGQTLMKTAATVARTVGRLFTRETDASPQPGEQSFDMPIMGLK